MTCFNKIKFLKLLPCCKSVNPLQRSYLNCKWSMLIFTKIAKLNIGFSVRAMFTDSGIIRRPRQWRYQDLTLGGRRGLCQRGRGWISLKVLKVEVKVILQAVFFAIFLSKYCLKLTASEEKKRKNSVLGIKNDKSAAVKGGGCAPS